MNGRKARALRQMALVEWNQMDDTYKRVISVKSICKEIKKKERHRENGK